MAPFSGSVAFDRAAELYDQTRVLSPAAMRAVVRLVGRELRGRGRCLEIGVGTGRIALPLAEAGVEMAGVDISLPMVRKLVDKAGGRPPFPLAMADATALPFADASFGSGLATHVLHLIPAWREAVRELGRVVKPGGVILISLGSWATPLGEVYARFAAEAGVSTRAVGIGFDEASKLDDEMSRQGARAGELPAVLEERDRQLEGFIRELEEGIFSVTWSIDEETRRRAGASVRRWARERFGTLDEPIRTQHRLVWRCYALP